MFALIQTGRSVSACVFSPPYPPVKKKKISLFQTIPTKLEAQIMNIHGKNIVSSKYVELSTMTNWVAEVDK